MTALNPTCEFCRALVGFDKGAHKFMLAKRGRYVAEVVVCGHCGELLRRLMVIAGVNS